MLDDRGKCWVFLAVDFCSMVFSRFLENKAGEWSLEIQDVEVDLITY